MRVRAALACVLVVLSVALTSAPSTADQPGVGLSIDGVHYADHLLAPIFAPGIRWVPGDSRTRTLYVRNLGPTSADVALQVERFASRALIGSGYLRIEARIGSGPWVDVTQGATRQLLDARAFAPGDSVPVTVRASVPWSAPNTTMVLSSGIAFRVVLSDSRVGSPTTGGDLPNTGSALRPWTVPLALLLLGSGTALVLSHRRTSPQEPPHV